MADWPLEYDHVFGLLEKVRYAHGTGHWHALCPAHDDRHPSLSLRVGRVDGEEGLLVCCHRCNSHGCTFHQILAALSARAGRPVCLRPAHDLGRPRKPRPRLGAPVATWDYRDETGTLLYQTLRYRLPDGKKTYRQRRPLSEGGWAWDLHEVRRVLYRLPELLQARQDRPERWVTVLEGEKNAEQAFRDGVLATTAVGGAGQFHRTETGPLQGASVAVFIDLDPVDPKTNTVAGILHGLDVVNALWQVAARVRLVRWPLTPGEGQDYEDWRRTLPPKTSSLAVRRRLWELVRHEPDWTPWGPVAHLVRIEQDAPARKRVARTGARV